MGFITWKEMKMPIDLPKPIADYVEANARLDVDGMMKPFVHDAVFIDNGKRFEGHAAIRELLEDEADRAETLRHVADLTFFSTRWVGGDA